MERKLPIIEIEGTEFLIDVEKLQLQEKADPSNLISFFDMRDLGAHSGYSFDYSLSEKNIPSRFDDGIRIDIVIPEMVVLDPEGMSKKYGVPLELFGTKSDFDIMVDQDALLARLSGLLPTVDIAGHTFYVDIRMDMLRPKDDFLSKGIRFSEIDNYFVEDRNEYIIPYNPKTKEFQEVDFSKVTAIPDDLIVVSFPNEHVLDPVGFNRKQGFSVLFNLKETNVKMHFKSRQHDWATTGINEAIKENISKSVEQKKKQGPEQKNKKGRKI